MPRAHALALATVAALVPRTGHSHDGTLNPMKTMKLRTFQQPSRLQSLLDSLVKSRNWVPAGAVRVSDRSELSSALQKLAVKVLKTEGAWRAWLGHDGVRFFTVDMSMELSRERGLAALKVSYYDDKGSLQQYGLWIQLADGAWREACGE